MAPFVLAAVLAPTLGFPAPPAIEAQADERTVTVRWAGHAAVVRTTRVGGPHEWRRTIDVHPTHIEVRDTVVNPGAGVVGLRIRHALDTSGGEVHLGGRTDAAFHDAYDPWNPTVFTAVGGAGIGLVAEDDVLRQQTRVDFTPTSGTAGLRTDGFCLGPGERHTLVWSIYPTSRDSYWDFINTVRRDWGVNRTVPGAFLWFKPDDVLALAPERLRAALERQRIGVASASGGWVDPRRPERPPRIGFGTYVLHDDFAAYRERLRAAVRALHAARPGITVLIYFDAQRDSTPDAPTRYADSLLLAPGERPERVDWGGRFSAAWGMVPTADNGFGKAMGAVARAMRDLGADGLYWDEMDGVDYAGPRITTGAWDGRSCVLDDRGGVTARMGLANLLSERAKLGWAAEGVVLGNMPATSRRFQDRGDLRMVEAQHNDLWGTYADLGTPLGYVGALTDWRTVRAKIDEGLLVAGARLDAPSDLVARMFPFTPEYLEPGTLRGRERIITTRSGTHGWARGAGEVHGYRYDAGGSEHPARWHVKRRHDALLVRVRLGPDEAAVLERD